MGGGIDLNAFMTTDDLVSAKRPALPGASPTDATAGVEVKRVSENDSESDDAIGEIFEVFDSESGPKPGDILV